MTDDYAALAALAEERRKFQAETLTTSFLAGLLRDGWTRCHRCGIRDGERVCVLGNLREWVCSPCLATPPHHEAEAFPCDYCGDPFWLHLADGDNALALRCDRSVGHASCHHAFDPDGNIYRWGTRDARDDA